MLKHNDSFICNNILPEEDIVVSGNFFIRIPSKLYNLKRKISPPPFTKNNQLKKKLIKSNKKKRSIKKRNKKKRSKKKRSKKKSSKYNKFGLDPNFDKYNCEIYEKDRESQNKARNFYKRKF